MAKPKLLNYFLFMCITVQIANSENLRRSLAIVFDVTSSMTDEINSLREGVKLLLESFTSRADNPISDYVFVQFRDEERERTILPTIVATDAKEIFKHLNEFGINPGRNGDCLESCFRGIKYGLEKSNDNSIMFVFTDAGTKHKEMKPELEKLIQQKKITVYFFLTQGCGRQDYEIQYYYDLAASSNGLVFDVDYRQIKDHFPKYREVINDKLGLNSQFKGGPGKSKVDVDVDTSMKEFTFTIVAQKPLITIYDPNNIPINDYEMLTDLPTIKMIKVKEPIPGKWIVQVEATTPYTGQVSVISDLSFKYGFSKNEPNDITQTSFSPLIGQNNYLTIAPSDSSLISNLEYVILDTKSGPHKFNLRKKTVADGDLYITESIELPKVAFKVVLHGIDPVNNAIKRLLSPDIAPRPPNKPETIKVPKINVQEGEPIYLICRVDSMVDITISWYKVGQAAALKSLSFQQSDILNHTISESQISDSGEYICVAKNSAGEGEMKTIVDVRRTILNVNTPIKQHLPKAGTKSLVLKCVVIPKMAGVNIHWLFNGNAALPPGTALNLPNLILNNINRNFNGTYTCVAQRNSEVQQDNIEVNVQYSAKILNMFNLSPYGLIDVSKPVEIIGPSELKVLCGHEGNPTANIKWINQDGVVVSSTPTLVVAGTDIKHAGDYVCQVENALGKDEKRIKVNITTKPKLQQAFDTVYRKKLGDRFSLECPLEVVPNQKMVIVWYQNTTRIQQSLILDDRITIEKLDHVHNGKYKCQASNKAGTVEAEFDVNVLYQAKILNILKIDNTGSDILGSSITRFEIFNTTKLSLTCLANGNPAPATTWKKDGVIFSSSNILEIDPTKTGFSALYTCTVQNELNSDERVIELFEVIKPKIISHLNNQNYRVNLGDQFTMECPLEISPNNKPDIVWYQNASRIQHSSIVNDRLKIDKLDHVHNGKYKCQASNKAGTVEAEFNVDVLYKAKITKIVKLDDTGSDSLDPSIKRIEIFNITTFSLTCITNGNPPPATTWKKNGVILSHTNKLEIDPTKTGFSASYACSIQNEINSDERIIELFEIIKPELDPALVKKNNRVKLGDQLSLECPLKISPNNKPNIVWYQNASRIQPSLIVNDRVKIDKLDHVHNGKYKCQASDKAGTVEAEFNVDVLYQAKILKIVKLDDTGSEILVPSIKRLEVFNITKFSLTCITNGNPSPATTWKKNGVILSHTNKLEIDPTKTGFSASYACSIQNEINSDERIIELFEIIKPELDPALVKKNNRVKLGDQLSLECPLKISPNNKPNIVWYQNASRIQPSLIVNDRVKIDKLDHVHNGKYKCQASDKAGTVEAEFNVDVLYQAKILKIVKLDDTGSEILVPSIKRLEVFNITKFSLTCITNGNPPPATTWKKNGVILSHTNKLEIDPTKTGFSASYACSIQNEINSDERIIELFEINKPELDPALVKKNNRVKLGDQLSLECPLKISPNNKPNIVWYQNASRIQPSLIVNDRVKIDKLDHVHNGKYKCQASDKAGTVEAEFNVDVLYQAKILKIVKLDDTGSEILVPSIKRLEVFNITKFSLTCITNGNPPPATTWKKNGVILSHTNKLEIDPTKTGFSASYACSIQNEINSDERIIELFEIIKPELDPALVKKNNRVKLGDQLSLECPLKISPNNKPNIVWYQNASRIQPSLIVNDRVKIDKLDHVHNGKYKCQASNKAGTVEAEFNVDVLYQAKILKIVKLDDTGSEILVPSIKRLEIFNITKFSLTCITNGNPPPATTWKKNGVILSHTNKLEIDPTKTGFSASYACSIQNEINSDERIIELFEINKPELDPALVKKNNRVKLGDQLSLECPLKISPNNKPNIVWYQNASRIQPSLIVNDRVKIDKLDHVHNGKYKCQASDKAGTVEAEFNVDVLYQAKILKIVKLDDTGSEILVPSIKRLEVFNITKFSLTCITNGNPPPATTWKKNGVILSHTNKLEIDPTKTGFSASYACSIQNEINSDERIIELFEIIKPELDPALVKKNNRVKLGDQLSLECPLKISPNNKPNIVWYQNASRIQPSLIVNDRVKIDKLDHVHNGKYKCQASNKAGTVEAEFNVDVLYQAKILKIVKLDDTGSEILVPSIKRLEIFNITKFSLTCITNGNPPPATTWKKNGVILSHTNKLEIDPTKTGFSASYACSIQNEINSDERIIELFEIIKPELDPALVKKNNRVKLGDQLSLECPLKISPNNKPNIVWYQNASRIQPSLIVNDRVKIDKLDHVHNGKYKCQASDKAGTVEAEFNVDVLYQAKILKIVKLDDTGSEILVPSIKRLEIFNITKFSLTCITNGNPPPATTWKKNGVILSHTNKLEIDPTKTGFSASYACSIQNEINSDERIIELFEIIKPKLNPALVKKNNRVKLGDQLSLECPLKISPNNKPNIVWYQNASRIQPSLIVNDRVKIDKLDHVHNGKYKCQASNKAGTVEAEFNVYVLYQAKILKIVKFDDTGSEILVSSIKRLEVFNITKFSLTCITNGNPPPATTWKKNGVILSHTNKLEIDPTKTGFSASYACSIQNEINSDERIIELFEIIKPELDPALVKKNNRVKLGDQLSLECPLKISPNNKPNIVWYQNASRIQPSLIVNDRVKIDKLDHVHNGKYKCQASDKAGTVEAEFNVDVLYQAKILKIVKLDDTGSEILVPSIKRLEIFNITKFSLTCITNGNPPPATTWKKNGVILSHTNKLEIDPTKTGFSASYACSIQNEINSDERIIELFEIIKPKLNPALVKKNNRVKLGDQLSLECPLKISPNNKPNIVWYQNASRIQPSLIVNDRVKIDKLDHVHNGKYKCQASNKAGTVEAEFNVYVLYQAKILKIVKLDDTGSEILVPSIKRLEIFNITKFSLTCITNGNPPPATTWKKNGVILSHTNKLEIDPTKTGFSASYACSIQNEINSDERIIELFEIIKPELDPALVKKNNRVKLGDQLSLECPLKISPNNKPNIVWYQNASRIQPSLIVNDRVKIDKLDHVHNGKYKCQASNKAGTVEAEFNVYVLYQAKILKIVKLDDTGSEILVPSIKRLEIFNITKFSLTCITNGNPPPATTWKKNGVILSHTNKLEIDPTKTGFSASYACSIQNEINSDERIIELFEIIKPELNPALVKKNNRVKLGDQLSLECPLKISPNNKPNIVWYQNASRIQPSLIVNDRVKIDKLDHVHNGKYKCQASNKAGTVEAEFNVYVLYQAKILKIVKFDDTGSEILVSSIKRLEVFNITKFSLTCITNGNPPPATTWKKNGVILSHTNKLEIDPTKTGFSASYACSIKNQINSDERVIELFEIIKPKLILYSAVQNLIENIDFHLTCPVKPDGYDVTWFFNGNNFNSHKQADGSLYINKVNTSMKGQAYCVATNKAGTAVATFNFDVLQPPYGLKTTTTSIKNRLHKIGPSMKQVTFVKDEPLDIVCNAQGNPAPDIYWLKNNQMYKNGNTIAIHSVGPSDGATYTCVAENTLGNQTEKITVIVYIPPYLLSTAGLLNSTNTNNVNKVGVTVLNRVPVPDMYFKADYEQIIKVNEGEKILLDCNMGGNPRPKLDWFKNNVNLNKQTAVLEFKSARIENSGIYKCVGGNTSRNKMVVIFYLNVQKPISFVSATSTKPVYELGDEIKFTCKTKGNQLPVIVWKGMGNATDNENIFKLSDDGPRKQALQQDEPLYLNGKKIVKLSDITALARYGKISYDFVDGEYIGTLEYVIKSAKFSDAGNYSCITRIYQVKNSQEHYLVKIDVGEAPYLENAETEYSILQDIAAHKIICPIKGIPNPTIQWYRETSVITSNQHFDVQNHFLEFKNPLLHHAGEYSCRGTNIGGSVEFKFKVIIFKHIADISNLVLNRSLKKKLEIEKSETKELQCSFKVMPIYWSKIIDAYPNKQRELLMANSTYNFYADISADIMCSKEADPKHGEIFQITVLEKPIIQQAESNVEVKLDDILRLQCDTKGEPKPTIKWYKYEQGQQYDIKNYPEFEANGEILIKRRVENADTTKYVCTAQNKLGTDSHVFDVIVLNDSHYFSSWSPWSACTKTCGQGTQFKTRNCIHASCNQERQREERECTIIECAVDGGWSRFTPFSQCSKTCVINVVDISTKQAKRECNKPVPAFGGKDCKGESVRILNCTVPLCASVSGHPGLIYPPCLDEPICCPNGFEHDDNTGGCKEIDKCQRKGPYAVCKTNTKCQNVGADDYECVCLPGYILNPGLMIRKPKNPICIDVNECKAEPYPCGEWKCANSRGSFKCLIGVKRRI